MKTRKQLVLFLFFLTSLTLYSKPSKIQKFSSPQLRFVYGGTFDEVCTQKTGFIIQKEWKEEFHSRQKEFLAEWKNTGSALLLKTQEIIAKAFEEKEFSATLSLCSFPSISDPLLINTRYWLKSFTPTPISTPVLVSTVFHEILHHYLENKIPKDSKLLKKYAAEDETVTSHLHLFAIQKSVYLESGQAETLTAVIKKDQSLPNPAYTRTWQIVNDLENYKDFVAELK